MSRVQIASLPWGVVQDRYGNAQSDLTATITPTRGAGTVFASDTGSSTTTPTTNTDGEIAGWLNPGQELTVTVEGESLTVKVPGDSFDAQAFDVVADGSNDDTAELQAAMDACSSAGGGEVLLPEGTILISSAISIPNFVNLKGQGQSTVVRCSGNHYAFAFNPGHRSSVSSLQVDASSAQSFGGAFNFASAGSNIWLDGIYLANNLHTGLNIAPTTSATAYVLRRLRWNGVTGCTNAITLGGGGALVTDIYFSDCIGTASTAADMTTWLNVPGTADTLKMVNCLFITGGTGAVLGTAAVITNAKFLGTTFDSMTGAGVNLVSVRECALIGCEISTCGGALGGLIVGGSASHARFVNGTVQNCVGDGVVIADGSLYTTIQGNSIADNNTGNTASRNGISVAANADRFAILGNVIGNNLGVNTGHQKFPIDVATGNSDHYRIMGNEFIGNDTGDLVSDFGTGTDKLVKDNLPAIVPTTASAATVTLPSYAEVHQISGTTTITSLTASWPGRRVTLIFQGALTFTDGSNLKLAGNFVTTADDTITLLCDGTNWFEASRAVN